MKAALPQKNNRIKSLQKRLAASDLDACLIESSVDLLYFTGLQLSAGKLLVHKAAALLLVDGRYFQVAKEKAEMPVAPDTAGEVAAFCQKNRVKCLGFDAGHTTYDQFLGLKQSLKKGGVQAKLEPSSAFFKLCRLIKSPDEIALMKKSAKLAWKGFLFLQSLLKTGITEKEMARSFEIFCLEQGADKLGFDPIIAFGKASAMPHYRPGNARLKEGDLVLIDIGVVLNHYHSDMTRVLFYKKEDPYLAKLYAITKKAQANALKLCRPGVKLKELDLAARSVMAKEKVEELFVHNLGHGIGLQCHEFPRISSKGEDRECVLEEGMAITIEPGLYVPGKGGVRYEDTVIITKTGHTNFYTL